MSVEQYGIATQLHLDPRIVSGQSTYTINKGGDDISYTRYSANSFSNSIIMFNVAVNNVQTFIDRKWILSVTAQFDFTGTPAPNSALMFPNAQMNGTDGLRWCPIQSNANSVQLQINGQQLAYEMGAWLEPLARYGFTKQAEDTFISTFPSMQDTFQTYSDGFNKVLNPLGEYGDNTTQQTRGAFSYNVISDTGTAASVVVTWHEPIMASPLVFTMKDHKALFSVNNIQLQLQLGEFSRMWSHDSTNGCTITTLTGRFTTTPELTLCTISPSPLFTPPPMQIYPLTNIVRYTTPGPTGVTYGQTFTIANQAIQLKDVPSRVYVFCRRTAASRTYDDTDTYCTLTALNIQFNNKSGMLAGASSKDLFMISARNGLQMSWNQWDNYTGSVMCVDFGKDIGLTGADAVGVLGTYNININCTFRSNYASATDVELTIVPLDEGVFTCDIGTSSSNTGMLTPQTVASSALENMPITSFADVHSFYGGSLGSRLTPFIRQASKAAYGAFKKYGPAIAKGAARGFLTKHAPGVYDALDAVHPGFLGDGYDGEGYSGGGPSGGYFGGAMIDDDDAQELLALPPPPRSRNGKRQQSNRPRYMK